jgi:hypothetical protein
MCVDGTDHLHTDPAQIWGLAAFALVGLLIATQIA